MVRFLLALLFVAIVRAEAQEDSASVAANTEKLRTESGVDPTRVASRLSYSIIVLDQTGESVEIRNRAKFTLGINRWSFALRQDLVSLHNGVPGQGFQTGAGDLSFSILNAFFVSPQHALAASAEIILPTGAKGITTNTMTMSPQLTYSYTVSPRWILAAQPQYTFDLYKDPLYPHVSVLTVRSFIATFLPSGWFFVFEPRPIYDFTAEQFDLILSPIAGTSLGGGFTLSMLAEFPTRKALYETRGMWIQTGLAKTL